MKDKSNLDNKLNAKTLNDGRNWTYDKKTGSLELADAPKNRRSFITSRAMILQHGELIDGYFNPEYLTERMIPVQINQRGLGGLKPGDVALFEEARSGRYRMTYAAIDQRVMETGHQYGRVTIHNPTSGISTATIRHHHRCLLKHAREQKAEAKFKNAFFIAHLSASPLPPDFLMQPMTDPNLQAELAWQEHLTTRKRAFLA